MTPAARLAAAIELLDQIAAQRRPADDIVRGWIKARRFVGAKDRRAIRERVYGVLRRQDRLDRHLGDDVIPTARLRVLADVVLDGDDPDALFTGEGHAPAPLDADERALAERLTGRALDDPAMPEHVRAEIPAWLADKLKPLYGDDFLTEMRALNAPAPMDLRVAKSRVTRDQARQALKKAGVTAKPTPLSPIGLRIDAHTDIARTPVFKKGLVEVQDEGSQLLSLLVGARPQDHVLDYCAGAGGKTLALADAMGLQGGSSAGRLAATDTDAARLGRMDRRLGRARLADLVERHVLANDDPWISDNTGAFDEVLVDAPCTGTGTWRRHPEQKKRLTPERLADLTATQDAVLASAAKLVKPGGRLVYATCSLLREENEDRVVAFLAAHGDFRARPIAEVWAETIKDADMPAMDGPYLRLSPARHGTDGFFVAVMERQA